MSQFPKDPSKIRARIRRYERSMRKEYETHGSIHDGYGKRYLLGILYLLMDDWDGALAAFQWYERMFPDDVGEPFHFLSWALALYHAGQLEEAALRLRQAMLSNLYMIPRLLGIEQEELDLRYGSMEAEKDYLAYAAPEIWTLWDDEARAWARRMYECDDFQRVRERYIEIHELLRSEPRGPRRSCLVEEMSALASGQNVSGG
jgi:tetratricopeptide (TPR) repeat protein